MSFYFVYVYLFLLLVAAIVSVVRFTVVDQAAKVFCILMVCTCVSEILALYVSYVFRNNLAVFAVFDIIQMVLTCLYFNYSIDIFYKWNLGIHFGAVSVILGILNILYLQPINTFNTYFLIYESYTIIAMSLFSFFRLLLMHEQLKIKYYIHFWIPVCLVFLWSATLSSRVLNDYFMKRQVSYLWIMELIVLSINILVYSSIGFLYYYYPKMKEKC